MATQDDIILERFRFAPEILTRLGEELIPGPQQGIIELVRNSYDADATYCKVALQDTHSPGGTVRIEDDGIGMTVADITDGWLVIGRSRKSTHRRSPRGRLPVGDKGLGRLAALRMGTSAILETRPQANPGIEFRVTIDWKRFANVSVVEDVEIEVKTASTDRPHGTTITIGSLARSFPAHDIERLARNLLLLADPFGSKSGFTPQLVAPGFSALESLVRGGYLDAANFVLTARLDSSGHASAELTDWRGRVIGHASHKDLSSTSEPFNAPVASFELWTFLLNPKSFSVRANRAALREWLKAVGGVYLYHRGLRVLPYGDPGHDWLDLNLSRARSPEERPSTNNSVGRVLVEDPDHLLLQKTDRTGFIESESFEALRAFCVASLEWMASRRMRLREARRDSDRRTTPKAVKRARANLDEVIHKVPSKVRPALEQAVQQLETARQREIRVIRDDLELYRTLGTVGTTVSVFAHESGKPVTQIEQMAKSLERRCRQYLPDVYDTALAKPIEIIQRSASALKTYARVPLVLLRKDRRKHGRVNVQESIQSTLEMFAPFLEESKIQLSSELVDSTPLIFGTSASIDSILSNLITNAITALTGNDAPRGLRRILIRTELHRGRLVLLIMDNGPGIRGIPVEDIWLPGRTTKPNGTGLGLTIVRDVVIDLSGTVTATEHGELGGAEFIVAIPLADGEDAK